MSSIGDRVAQFRKHKSLSLKRFSAYAGMSDAGLSSIEKSSSSPSVNTLQNILDAFPELNPEWLYLGKGDMLLSSEDCGDSVAEESVASYKTTLAFASASVDSLSEAVCELMGDLTEGEKRLIFDRTQELLQFRVWRRDVEKSLDEIVKTVAELKHEIGVLRKERGDG